MWLHPRTVAQRMQRGVRSMPPTVTGFDGVGVTVLCGTPVEQYMANVVTELLQHRDQASGLKAQRAQPADGGPAESVAVLGATLQVAVGEPCWPGQAVVQAHFMLQGAVPV